MNEADSSKIAAMLQEVGYERTEEETEADIVVLNSCVVRQAAEDKGAGKLNSLIRLKRAKPEVPVVLTGCMVTNQQEALQQRFPHVDLFFNPSDFGQLEKVVPELGDLDDDLTTGVVGAQGHCALLTLPGGDALRGWLDAVVDGVAHQVGQRVLDRLEQRPVQLGLPTQHGEGDLALQRRGQVAHHAGHLVPHVVDGLHACLHHAFLQLTGDEAEALGGAGELGVLGALFRGTWIDHTAMTLSLAGIAMPNFWLGLMLVTG